ncbi:MAG: alpha/beta fold hydrolase [Actinomycetota bacterium]|nr:alpha/beta fold hydrolase [Actinomycetota bacterium]
MATSRTRTAQPPPALRTLIARYDPETIDLRGPEARIRLGITDGPDWDVVLRGRRARFQPALESRAPDARLTADLGTWERISGDLRGGMDAFRRGRLRVRQNLHLGVGLLAATSGTKDPARLRFESLRTSVGSISTMQAGRGEPVVLVHGLGATKASFLPTIAALANSYRLIALDLPGSGDSDKPIAAPYNARYFARAVVALLDALGLERAHLIGNSMGGRVALEAGLHEPERVGRLVLLSPALAWLRERRLAPLVRALRPELGLMQVAPRPVVEGIVRRVIPGGSTGWTAAGVDEFLRSYCSPRGRAAFYAAARNVYLDEPLGERGLWTRMPSLQSDALFVWGRHDTLVPVGFRKHVERALPAAQHVVLDCGHVPQLEASRPTHAAIRRFLQTAPARGGRVRRAS